MRASSPDNGPRGFAAAGSAKTPTLVVAKPGGRLKVGVEVGVKVGGEAGVEFRELWDSTADVSGVGDALAAPSGSTMTGSAEALGVGAVDAAGDAGTGWDSTLLGVLVLEALALGEDGAIDEVVPVSADGVGEPVEEEPVADAGGAVGR